MTNSSEICLSRRWYSMFCSSGFWTDEIDCLKWTPGTWSCDWCEWWEILDTEFWLVCKLDGTPWAAVTVNLRLIDCGVFDCELPLDKAVAVTAGKITVFGSEWKPMSCAISCTTSIISSAWNPNDAEFLDLIEVLLTAMGLVGVVLVKEVLLNDKVSSLGLLGPLPIPSDNLSGSVCPFTRWTPSSPPSNGVVLSSSRSGAALSSRKSGAALLSISSGALLSSWLLAVVLLEALLEVLSLFEAPSCEVLSPPPPGSWLSGWLWADGILQGP